ncbi:PREDICTED: elongation of very long chain fatty acids protein 4-like [Nicrophorus vespilloides]|uniref:Elongation of very long chain fatty acids protein n=1 Tax=Nicrophorus vespilloides TaxID=110193 RepID=A0ABM1MCL5_NICVS|nr:PREDICTED: elongation of very long chain fatty acids protein 4-like [Nicrophorus vespilloides]
MDTYYNHLFVKLADDRVSSWPLMQDPTKILLIISIYLYGVYVYLPKHMKGRKPYNLKNIIQIYNVLQVISCLYIVHGLGVHGWFGKYTVKCQTVDYSDDKSALKMLNYVYWTLILKIAELLETCFFILRNKMNQVSKLHVYHHCSTLMFAWLTCKYMGGGMATFAIIINSTIHVIMYSYYFLAASGPRIQKKISWVKPKITMMQMVQFWVLLLHSVQALHPDCNMPKLLAYIFLPNLAILFGFFLNFYFKSYTSKKLQ